MRRRLSGRGAVILLIAAVLVVLVVVPAGMILWASVRGAPAGLPAHLTTASYRQALTGTFARSLETTAVFATLSTIGAITIAGYLAWLTERTNVPLRRAIYLLVLAPIAVPGILTAISWSVVLNPRTGIANGMVSWLGIRPFNGFTFGSMVWVEATESITLPFLLIAAALRSTDPALEEASATSGASPRATLRRVTIPVVAPSIVAAALIVFIKTVESFETPVVLGLRAGVRVLATDVYLATSRSPRDTNLAAALGMITLVITLAALALHGRATQASDRFANLSGARAPGRRVDLGRRRVLHAAIAMGVLALAVGVPLLAMVYTSLLPFYRPPSTDVLATMTLGGYRDVLGGSALIGRALRNNVIVGGGAALVATTLGTAIAWLGVRTRVRGRQVLDAAAFAPIAFPGLVLGLALLWVYVTLPLPIYGTRWLIGVAYVTAFTPFALRASGAALTQVGTELEEASRVSGASWWRTFRRIVAPLAAPGITVGLVYVFARTLKALGLVVLLGGPGTEVLPVVVFDLYDNGKLAELSALGVLMVVAIGAILIVTRVAVRASGRAVVDEPVVAPA